MPGRLCLWVHLPPSPSALPLRRPPAGPSLGCLAGHGDTVTSLAASAAASGGGGVLASGGLQGEVLLWDLAALRVVMAAGGAQVGGLVVGGGRGGALPGWSSQPCPSRVPSYPPKPHLLLPSRLSTLLVESAAVLLLPR